jgi:hypothetical protein
MSRPSVSFLCGALLGFLLFCNAPSEAQRPKVPKRQDSSIFLTDIPEYPGNLILGRPASTSITLSILWQKNIKATLVYGIAHLKLPTEGQNIELAAKEPKLVQISGLTPDTEYEYALLDASTGKRILPADRVGIFHTARARGQTFTFAIQADSHLDGACLPEFYRRTLANALADSPDFLIDLGDTFMTEKHASPESAAKQYAAQRYYLGLIGQLSPIFLAIGNHDGENLDRSGRTQADSLAIWSHQMRTRFFPNPVPDGFYTGNESSHPIAGLLENYYAWEWGDALFVVLDPYWTSLPTRGGQAPWNRTIGLPQYEWLARTLRNSKARFKFVFIHQLTGSYDEGGRGGVEAAIYQEWGGKNLDGSAGFNSNRPGWQKPIHQLLVEAGTTAVFHGHDHFYARQELDGIIYQLVPQPDHEPERSHHAEEYGYKKGLFIPSSGYLRVKVAPERVAVDYVRSALPENERSGIRNGSIADSYVLLPKK